jgi:hypothetical protein
MSIYNATSHEWQVVQGNFTIFIGSSSGDFRTKATISNGEAPVVNAINATNATVAVATVQMTIKPKA